MTPSAKRITKPRPNPLLRFLPILEWLPKYDRAWLNADVLAGLTLWGLVALYAARRAARQAQPFPKTT